MRNISVIMAANVESMTEKGDHSFGTLLSNVEYLSTTTGKSVQKYELYIVYTKNQGSHFHFFFFAGSRNKIHAWFQQVVDKYCFIHNIQDSVKKAILLQSFYGAVSDFVYRHLLANSELSYAQLRDELRHSFRSVGRSPSCCEEDAVT